jgi:hypothetical protein
MVHFVAHCGVTNGVYYQTQTPSAFPAPLFFKSPPPVLYTVDTEVVVPPVPAGVFGPRAGEIGAEPRCIKCSHAAYFLFGPPPNDRVALFFSAWCANRTFILSVFPAGQYKVRNTIFIPPKPRLNGPHQLADPFHPAISGPGNGHDRVLPPSRYLVHFGCPVCGEYSRKCGYTLLSPRGAKPAAYLVEPLELPSCPRCGVNQSRCDSTAVGVRLDAPLGSPIWATADGAWRTPYPLADIGRGISERSAPPLDL